MYIVAYDITDDRERRLVSRVLDGYGHGVQHSVYLCHIRGTQARRMMAALKALDVKSGFILCWKSPDSSIPERIGSCPPNLPLGPDRVFII